MAGITHARAEERAVPHIRVPHDQVFSKHFRQIQTLGQGSFGVVSEAERLSDGTRWAIKTLQKDKAGSTRFKLLEKEIQILKMISHPTIVAVEEIYETPAKMHLVMELCELGTLERQLDKVGRYTEEDVKPIMQQLANAVAYLHRNGIVHRDVKLENILCTANAPCVNYARYKNRNSPESCTYDMYIKLTDFSISALKEPDEMIDSVCGTLIYMSPEIIEDRLYSQQCDVWAMGIIMYQLLSGVPPFRARDEETLKDLIRDGYLDFSASTWRKVSEMAIDCIRKLLKVDTAYRITASELLEHPWLNDAAETNHRPNVIELMKAFRLTQGSKGSSNGDDAQSHTSSSSDLQLSDQTSSADSTTVSKVSNNHLHRAPHLRSETKLNSSSAGVRAASSLSDSQSAVKPNRLNARNLSQEIESDSGKRSRDASRSRYISQVERNASNHSVPLHARANNSTRQISTSQRATNKRT